MKTELLESIYNRIKTNEIRMNESDQYESDVVTFMNPVKSGWIIKKSFSFIPQKKKRWFVLSQGSFFFSLYHYVLSYILSKSLHIYTYYFM